jgi:signal transduction histidine kinase
MFPGRSNLTRGIQLAALLGAYVLTGRLGLKLDAISGFATLVWPPAGVALVTLLTFGLRAWPLIAVGAFVVNVSAGAPLPAAFGIGAGNTLEAVAALLALRRLRFDPQLGRVRDAVAFIIAAGSCAAVGATLGSTSLWAVHVVSSARYAPTWSAWWLGDVLGVLVVAPVMLVWLLQPPLKVQRPLELAGLIAVLIAGAVLSIEAGYAYVVYPPLIWAALRFRQQGAATSVFVVGAVAITGTVLDQGPFVHGSLSSSLVLLESFMGITAATTLLLGSAIAERDVASTARDEFLAVASHELRTPLTSLKLHIEMLRRSAARGEAVTADKLAEKVLDIEEQTNRLSALISEVLEVTRAVAGRFQLDLVDMDLSEAAADATKRLNAQAQHAGCALKLDAEACAGRWDRTRVDHILTSLISNAIKFGPGQPVEVTVKAGPSEAVLTVRDHGIGIKPEDQARIFERFERAVSMRHFGGLGLGLWLVRQVVDAFGGSISVKSEPGQGSEFIVVLPRRPSLA